MKGANILSAALCMASMVSMFSCSMTTGIDNYSSAGLIYELNASEDGYIVVGCDSIEKNVRIPTFYQDLPVVAVDDRAFFGRDDITRIIIGNNVTKIGQEAFYKCVSLKDLTIDGALENIGNYSFYGCSDLHYVTLPDSVMSIGNYSFYGCSDLHYVTLPDSVMSIGDSAFRGCYALTEIDLSESLINIGSEAFYYCVGLTNIKIPKNVTSIGSNVFYGCAKLNGIRFDATETWYITNSGVQWMHKTGGTEIDVVKPSANATYFKETHNNYYWYKISTETKVE